MVQKLLMKNDIVFKAFFHRNQQYTKSFLSAILGKNIKIKRIMHDARLEQLTKEMKYGVLDLDVELENGEILRNQLIVVAGRSEIIRMEDNPFVINIER